MLSFLMPEAASSQAIDTDKIYYLLLGLSAAIILLVLALVIGFSIRFRRGSSAPRGELPAFFSREFEVGWTSATVILALFLFWFAASSQLSILVAPKDALEIHVVAKQWMWKTQHGNGVSEINELHVPINTPIRLIMASQDVIHSFFVPAFRLKRDVVPGRSNETWFNATKVGMYHLFCAEYCGTDHSRMLGRIVVMSKEDFGRWLSAQPRGDALAEQGAKIFRAQGCSGCHVNSSAVHAPDLRGIYGQTVQLAGGKTVTADEDYLRDLILMPKRDIVAGYDPIMPSYQGILSDAELDSLTAYIRSLTTGDQP